MPTSERIFIGLTSFFIALLVLTNVIAGKYITFLGFPISCSILVYPFTFVIADIVSEVYGMQRAKMLVITGFIVSFVVAILVWIANILPIAPTSPIDHLSFSQIFGMLPGIVVGSMVGYLVSQFLNVRLFDYLRILTKNRYLVIRNIICMLISQFLDTIIVITISWVIWPMLDKNSTSHPVRLEVWIQMLIGQYIFKGLMAFLDTPLMYVSTYFIKKHIALQRK